MRGMYLVLSPILAATLTGCSLTSSSRKDLEKPQIVHLDEYAKAIAFAMSPDATEPLRRYNLSDSDLEYLKEVTFVGMRDSEYAGTEYRILNPDERQVLMLSDPQEFGQTNTIVVLDETEFWNPIKALAFRRLSKGSFPASTRVSAWIELGPRSLLFPIGDKVGPRGQAASSRKPGAAFEGRGGIQKAPIKTGME